MKMQNKKKIITELGHCRVKCAVDGKTAMGGNPLIIMHKELKKTLIC